MCARQLRVRDAAARITQRREMRRALAALAAGALVPTFSYDVRRNGQEIIGRYDIVNTGPTDVDLQGLALKVQFPGLVLVKSDDGSTAFMAKALPIDWQATCYWTYVEGTGTNVCSSIQFVTTAKDFQVRFVDSINLCPGCRIRGDSSLTSFSLRHSKYFPVVFEGDAFKLIGVEPFTSAPPPPSRPKVCLPPDLDFSISASTYPSRDDNSEDGGELSLPLGTAGYDAFLRIFINLQNRASVDYDMSDVVIRFPFDWTIVPDPVQGKVQRTREEFVERCHGSGSVLCDVSYMERYEDGFAIRFRDGFSLCPGCSLRGRGHQECAYEISSPFLFPLDGDSLRNVSAACERM